MVTVGSLPGLLRFQRQRSSEPVTALALSVTSLTRTCSRQKSPVKVANGRPLTPAARWRSFAPTFPSATCQLSVSLNSLGTSKKSPPGQMLRLHFRGLGGTHKGHSPGQVQLEGVVGTQSFTHKRQSGKVSWKRSATRRLKRRQRREPSELEGWGQEEL